MLKDGIVTESAEPHVIVVGGGVAGLVAARELLDAGLLVTLLEASDHLGGKVAPHTVGGMELDSGAESFATRGGTVAGLLASLGMTDLVVPPAAGGAWLQPRSGPAVPLPKASMLGIPARPLARDVVRIVGLGGALRAQFDALLSGSVGSQERTLGALVRKRMGDKVLERLVAPVAGGIHSAHPDTLDTDVVAPRLRATMLAGGSLAKAVLTLRASAPAGSAVQGIFGGLFHLSRALETAISGRATIHLGTTVTAADAHGVTLADGSRLSADRVIVAAELGAQTGVPIVLATLVVRSSALDAAPRGTGVLVAGTSAHSFEAKALTHASVKWSWLRAAAPDLHVLRLSYASAPDSDTQLREIARADATRLLGVTISPSQVIAFERVLWRGAASSHSGSAPDPLPGIDSVIEIGERISGTGLASVIDFARTTAVNLARTLREEPELGLSDEQPGNTPDEG